jgi:cystathionine gamma-synthase
MERHYENATAIVDFLASHPKVEKVIYPFHASHPQQKVAMRQMKNGGGMISFIIKGGREAAIRVVEATKIFALAESLGGVESLIEVPAAMTHLSVAGSQLEVDPALIRLSVGLEHQEDLIEDIKQALEKA